MVQRSIRRRRRPIPYTVYAPLFLPPSPPPFATFWRFYCIYIFHYKLVAKNWRHLLFCTHPRALYNSKFSLNFV